MLSDSVSQTSPFPTERGCYIRNKNGCSRRPDYNKRSTYWTKDDWGMQHRESGKSKENCDKRIANYNNWCETTGFESHFNLTDVKKNPPWMDDFSKFKLF